MQIFFTSQQIRELPKSAENLTKLETLDLFDNRLQEIPDCLQNFKKLQRLDLDEVCICTARYIA